VEVCLKTITTTKVLYPSAEKLSTLENVYKYLKTEGQVNNP
jgi:hypothetical protein